MHKHECDTCKIAIPRLTGAQIKFRQRRGFVYCDQCKPKRVMAMKAKKSKIKNERHMISLRLPPDVLKYVDDIAVKEDRSRNYMIVKLLRELSLA